MLSNPDAQASTPSHSAPSTQDPITTPAAAHDISRSPVEQGNTSPEKTLNKPLDEEEKNKLILATIQKDISYPILRWGSVDLYYLLNFGSHNHVGIDEVQLFFRELLLFVAKPKTAKAFHKEVTDGLQKLGRLAKFFADLAYNDHLQEFCDYNDIELGVEDDKYDRIAKRYLTGPDLAAVLAPTPKEDPALARMMARMESDRARDKAYYEKKEADLFDSFTLKTDEQLVAALDKYYPREQWPADKITIARDRRMIEHLNELEAEQVNRQGEAPELTQERTMRTAIFNAIKRREHKIIQQDSPTINGKTKKPAAAGK